MARVVVEGVPHHITQRVNNRQDVFLLSEDRRFYLTAIEERRRAHGVTLLGCCLTTNHVHLEGAEGDGSSAGPSGVGARLGAL